MELRSCSDNFVYDINAVSTYPRIKVTETIKRNGYQGKTYDLSHYTVFKAILSDNRKETLSNVDRFPFSNILPTRIAFRMIFGNPSELPSVTSMILQM